jgi:hypothetical protein
LNAYFEGILGRVLERLQGTTQAPVKVSLKKHLLQVFLSALYYHAGATIRYMEMKQVTKSILVDVLQNKKSFRNTYEQKCFIVGMTHILTVPDAPEAVRDPATTSRLIQELLQMLEKVQKKESKEAKKKATKQIHREENSDGESDDDESDMSDTSSDEGDDDDEDDAAVDGAKGKRSRGSSAAAEEMMDEEESKTAGDGGGLGFVGPAGTPNRANGHAEDDLDDDSDDDYDCQVSILYLLIF